MHNTFFKQAQHFLVRNSGRFSVATTSTFIFENGLRSWSKERYGLLITLLRISMNNHVFRLLLILVGHTAKNWPTVKTYQWKPIDVINNSVFCSLSSLSSCYILSLIALLVSTLQHGCKDGGTFVLGPTFLVNLMFLFEYLRWYIGQPKKRFFVTTNNSYFLWFACVVTF